MDRAGAVAASALAIDDIAIFVRSADAAAACGRSRVRAAGARVEVECARRSRRLIWLALAGLPCWELARNLREIDAFPRSARPRER